jgi:hypothetical protein
MGTGYVIGQYWNYSEWFSVPKSEVNHPVIDAAEKIANEKNVGKHPFIELARNAKEPLIHWTKQELIITGPFSLFLFKLCTQIKNVHIRALMSQIAHGEHGSVRSHVAYRSHPWLLHTLTESMGIAPDQIIPAEETLEYLKTLDEESSDLIRGLGALGIGSEFLLLEEYSAIKSAFIAQHPTSRYEDFLDSNINEDRWHSSLIEVIASNLITNDEMADKFLRGAESGVDARVRFYDRAFERLNR